MEEEDQEAADRSLDSAADALPAPDAALRGVLSRLRRLAADAAGRADSRALALCGALRRELLRPDGSWNDARVAVFTEYRDTQRMLADFLRGAGLAGEDGGRLLLLNGGMDVEERERVRIAFQAPPQESPARILLATDAASEGVNLQNHCSTLIHYDIPWNPVRLEQRNGRIDRHGQKAPEVRILHFIPAGCAAPPDPAPADPEAPAGVADFLRRTDGRHDDDLRSAMEFLLHVARRTEAIRRDLGRMAPVVAAEVERFMRVADGAPGPDAARAEREAAAARSLLATDRSRRAIAGAREAMENARRELEITPENILRVAGTALRLAGQPPLKPADPADVPGIPAGRAFRLPPASGLEGPWKRCLEGSADPYTGRPRPAVLDPALTRRRNDLVLLHLEHRLIRMCLGILRGELWADPRRRRLGRAATRLAPDSLVSSPAVVAPARLVTAGATGSRLNEEIVLAGGRIRGGRFERMNVGDLGAVFEGAMRLPPRRAPEEVEEHLMREIWPAVRGDVSRALERRREELRKGAAADVRRLLEREEGRIRALMDDLERRIRAELGARAGLTLLDELDAEDRAVFHADQEALEQRLKGIPRERDEEIALLRRRCGNPRVFLLPLALVWIIPESLAASSGGRA